MIETTCSQFPSLLQKRFDLMPLPPEGQGVAIWRESPQENVGATFARLKGAAVVVSRIGEKGTVERQTALNATEAASLTSVLHSPIKKSACIYAEDILDGETYFVKWSDSHRITQLVLGNPSHITDRAVRAFQETLDLLIKAASRD